MAFNEILYDVKDGIATITLNRPEKLNAWTQNMGTEVPEAMAMAANDDAVRVIILTGAGRGFCAGADMSLLGGIIDNPDKLSEKREVKRFAPETAREDFNHPYAYLASVPKPIVAAINGPAAGLGLIISLYCDIRIASADARMGTAFSRRGLIAEHGISWLLPRMVGMANATDLLFSARMIGADEAQRMGLVNRVAPQETFMEDVRAYCQDMVQNVSPRSMRVMKRQVYEAQFQTLKEAIDVGNAEMMESFVSEDFKEGVAHFMEKRAPNFPGR